ncbi:hypothetical protein [Roseibium sp. M-1]
MPDSSNNHIKDPAAAAALGNLLLNAADELNQLGNEPILIIAYPHKYNDAGYDDYWCAVQVGRSYWEASQFYRYAYLNGYRSGQAPEFDSGAGHVAERANYVSGESNQLRETPETLRKKLKTVRNVLSDLEKTAWRDLSVKALGLRDSFGLGLYLINGGTWLIQTHYSGADEGHAWYCNMGGELSYFAEVLNATTGIGDPRPIRFVDIDAKTISKLDGAARDWYFPLAPTAATPDRYKSLQDLSALLLKVAGKLRSETAGPITLSSIKTGQSDRNPNPEVRWLGHGFYRSEDNQFVMVGVSTPYPASLNSHQIQDSDDRVQEIVQEIGKQLDYLESRGWRQLFGEAFACPLQDHDDLHLMIAENDINLLRSNSAFCLEDGLLRPVGFLSDDNVDWLFIEHSYFSEAVSVLASKPETEESI